MYPNGVSEIDKGYVSLYLHKESEFSPVEAVARFSVLNNGGKIKFRKIHFSNESKNRGYRHFMKHSSIKPNDQKTFTVLCELSVHVEYVVNSGKNFGTHSIKIEPAPLSAVSQLSKDMYSLLESGELSDCTVVSGGREFKCHKTILGGRSSVFKEKFASNMDENFSDRVVVDEYDADTVNEMLFYIYTGTTRDLHNRAPFLLSAAEKYRLE